MYWAGLSCCGGVSGGVLGCKRALLTFVCRQATQPLRLRFALNALDALQPPLPPFPRRSSLTDFPHGFNSPNPTSTHPRTIPPHLNPVPACPDLLLTICLHHSLAAMDQRSSTHHHHLPVPLPPPPPQSYRNTAPVPRHWSQKRKYLQGKRGIEKPPFKLPDFIEATGIGEMRQG